MELIPILSTIILVATISTFMLAIGAYILYKVRERKGQTAIVPQPSEVKAELVTPAAAQAARPVEQERIIQQPIYIEQQPIPAFQRQPIIIEQQAPAQPRFSPQPQPYPSYRQQQAQAPSQQRAQYSEAGYVQRTVPGQNYKNQTQAEKQFKDSKFLKYTAEGYVPAKEDKDAGALKWR